MTNHTHRHPQSVHRALIEHGLLERIYSRYGLCINVMVGAVVYLLALGAML